ncbi:MAG: group III truncated hemoglobin [Bacteroidia bacterium]|nr:group III truncated hemoglobin [Bacteroidia bacterium]
MASLPDIRTEADVDVLVKAFYAQMPHDPVIGHFFADPAHFNWDTHIPRMVLFWSAVLLGTPGFSGNALEKHLQLHQRIPMSEAHFRHWLARWRSTLEAHFAGPKAEEAYQRAEHIARVIYHKVAPEATAGL